MSTTDDVGWRDSPDSAPRAAPMVRLAESGEEAPGLSYNVPDPTSYPGRNYLVLEFDDSGPFRRDAVVVADGDVGAATEAEAVGEQAVPALSVPGLTVTRFVADPVARLVRPGKEPLGQLEPLMPDTVWPDPVPAVPFEPPEPFAAPEFLSPGEGAVFTGPDGMAVAVRVRVSFSDTARIPTTISLAADAAQASATGAPRTGSGRRTTVVYEGTLALSTGANRVWATVDLDGVPFTVGPRTVVVVAPATEPAAESSPPRVTIETPEPQYAVTLPAPGTVTLTVAGTVRVEVVDPAGPVSATVAVDGGAAEDLALGAGGAFSRPVTLTTAGEHRIVVSARNGEHAAEDTRTVVVHSGVRPRHRLLIVECLRLSNFLGQYGAGRVVQTASLLPGEESSVTVRAFDTSSTSDTSTASIFDSYSDTSSDELSEAVQAEDTTRSTVAEEMKAHVNASAGGSWGFASAKVDAGLSTGSSSGREQMSRNVLDGASRHAAEKSSQRDVKVDTTKVVTAQSSTEQTTIRTVRNPSLAHTLNFVFRQMTQEYISLLHLVDVRIGLMTDHVGADSQRVPGSPVHYEEVSLPQLDGLLARVFEDSSERVNRARAAILGALDATFDHEGTWQPIVEEVSRQVPVRDARTGRIRTVDTPADPAGAGGTRPVTRTLTWTRFAAGLRATYTSPSGGPEITVPGVLLGVTRNSMRTGGVVVDGFLGGGLALDRYGVELQRALVRLRLAEARRVEEDVERLAAARAVVEAADAEKASVFSTVFPPPPAPAPPDGGGSSETR